MNSIFRTEKLGKIYLGKKNKKTEALHDITFEIGKNEIVGIMGPSGCGKTTLAKILAGIEEATSGSYYLFDEDCTHGVPRTLKQRIGYIYQDHNLLPWRSVEDNLMFPLEILKLDKDKKYLDLVDEALEIVGLSEYRNCLPQELSGGMMQRVGIARALVTGPDILIMDQPFGALDAITRKKLNFDFLKIFAQSDKTIIIITNSIDEALLFSNRIYIMSDAPGTIKDVIDVDVPFEERNKDIASDERFSALRAKLISIIKTQYANEESR